MFCALEAVRLGGVGSIEERMSAAPETEVCARLPCLDIKSRDEAMSEAVVLMLYVWSEEPPVPTISHWLYTLECIEIERRRMYQSAMICPFRDTSSLYNVRQGW